MLHFCNSNIFYSGELTNDIADEVWTDEVLACKNYDIDGIYEGVKVHKYTFEELEKDKEFFKNKTNIFMSWSTLRVFVYNWYEHTVGGDSAECTRWLRLYKDMYVSSLISTNVWVNGMGYFEALALHDLNTPQAVRCTTPLPIPTQVPEFSWAVADFYRNGGSVWEDFINSVIQKNVRSFLYKAGNIHMYDAPLLTTHIPSTALNITIRDIDPKDPKALWYFHNPFGPDFHTNVFYIKEILQEVAER